MMNYYMYIVGGALGAVLEPPSPPFYKFLDPALAIPTSPFFHLLVNGFSVTSFCTFSKTPYLYYTGGRYRWAGRN